MKYASTRHKFGSFVNITFSPVVVVVVVVVVSSLVHCVHNDFHDMKCIKIWKQGLQMDAILHE